MASVTSSNSDIKMDINSLDQVWQNRHNLETQEKMLKFIEENINNPDTSRLESFEISWRIARFVYFIGNFGVGENLENERKISIFQYGYQEALKARELEPKKVEGHFWYASNLGSYGLAKGVLSALNNAREGRDALLEAARIDPSYMWGGPYRILGRYYQEVPSFISFGDKKIAEEYFQKAINIAPKFRLNTMYLGILKRDLGEENIARELFLAAEKKPAVDGKTEEEKYMKELREDLKSVKD